MKQLNAFIILVITMFLSTHLASAGSGGPYQQPIRAESVKIQVYVEQPKKITPRQLRKLLSKPTKVIGVEVKVTIRNYLPRGLSPVLLIDGKVVSRNYRVVDVNRGITTLGFLLENPNMLKENGSVYVQYGENKKTRSKRLTKINLNKVKVLGLDSAQKAGISLPKITNGGNKSDLTH